MKIDAEPPISTGRIPAEFFERDQLSRESGGITGIRELLSFPEWYVSAMDESGPDSRITDNNGCIVTSEIGEPASPGDLLLIGRLNARGVGGAYSFRIDGTILAMQVHLLDPEGFRNTLAQDTAELRGSSFIHEDAFQDLVAKVESIRSYGIRCGKRVYGDYAAERRVKGRRARIAARGAWNQPAPGTPPTGVNDLPLEYHNQVVCGDSLQILHRIPGDCVDIIVTSPPYNFGLGYDASADGICWEEYFSRLFAIFDECIRVLKQGGRILVNVQPLFSDHIPSHHVISSHFLGKNMIWKGEILWEKNNYNCKYTAWGSWKSPSNPYLKYTWEFIEIFAKGDLTKRGKAADIDISADEFKKWVNAKWAIAPVHDMKKYDHPAMFPEELVERALKLFSYKNDLVLDPFNGVGTTTAVAKRLQRRYLGIDISEKYCRKARQRLEKIP
jgi:DNA modification methylase